MDNGYEDFYEQYKRIAHRIDAEYIDESLSSRKTEIRRIKIRKKVEGVQVDFIAHDMKVTAGYRVGYSRPFSGIFVPIVNRFDFRLHIVNKFGFDFLKPKFNSKYQNSSHADFNKKFLIKTNNVANMEKVLKRKETRDLIRKMKIAHVGVDKKYVFLKDNSIIEQEAFYIEQDHWMDDERTIADMLQVGGGVLADLVNSRIVELINQ